MFYSIVVRQDYAILIDKVPYYVTFVTRNKSSCDMNMFNQDIQFCFDLISNKLYC